MFFFQSVKKITKCRQESGKRFCQLCRLIQDGGQDGGHKTNLQGSDFLCTKSDMIAHGGFQVFVMQHSIFCVN